VSFALGSEDVPRLPVDVSVGSGQPLAKIPHVRGTL
jgi:hypothetical protein